MPGIKGHLRPLRWVASARKDYGEFPEDVQDAFGFQLHLAQLGMYAPSAKLLKGFGSGIVELVDDFDGTHIGPSTQCALNPP